MVADLHAVTHPKDTSANEIETLIFKAARGGGLPLGCAEDLAAAARYLDLDGVKTCPCSGPAPATMTIPTALDLAMAGDGPQTVAGDAALIKAYVAAAQTAWKKRLIWTQTPTGAVFNRFENTTPERIAPKGRREIPPTLTVHLVEMGAKILVPETEASRQAGAGAGLTDND